MSSKWPSSWALKTFLHTTDFTTDVESVAFVATSTGRVRSRRSLWVAPSAEISTSGGALWARTDQRPSVCDSRRDYTNQSGKPWWCADVVCRHIANVICSERGSGKWWCVCNVSAEFSPPYSPRHFSEYVLDVIVWSVLTNCKISLQYGEVKTLRQCLLRQSVNRSVQPHAPSSHVSAIYCVLPLSLQVFPVRSRNEVNEKFPAVFLCRLAPRGTLWMLSFCLSSSFKLPWPIMSCSVKGVAKRTSVCRC